MGTYLVLSVHVYIHSVSTVHMPQAWQATWLGTVNERATTGGIRARNIHTGTCYSRLTLWKATARFSKASALLRTRLARCAPPASQPASQPGRQPALEAARTVGPHGWLAGWLAQAGSGWLLTACGSSLLQEGCSTWHDGRRTRSSYLEPRRRGRLDANRGWAPPVTGSHHSPLTTHTHH